MKKILVGLLVGVVASVIWFACGTPIPFDETAISTSTATSTGTSSPAPAACGSIVNFTTGQAASLVIGQPDFTTSNFGTSDTTYGGVQGVWVASSTVYVTDNAYHRVLGYASMPAANGASATFVLGQSSMTAGSSGSALSQMFYPQTATTAGNKLFVADASNNRVLVWNSLPSSNGAAADFAFPSGGLGCAANQLKGPEMAFSDGTKLIVSDNGNHRVLIYNQIPASGSATPDLILGQPDATTCTASAPATQSSLSFPQAVWTDGTRLLVVDQGHNRVLAWNSFPTSNNQNADLVIGQPDFTTETAGTTAQKMQDPWGVVATCNQIFVADFSNNRVLIYNSFPTANNASADVVLGQSSFTSSTPQLTQTGLSLPINLFLDGTRLLVAAYGNTRVLIYNGN